MKGNEQIIFWCLIWCIVGLVTIIISKVIPKIWKINEKSIYITQKCYNMKNIIFHIIILFLSESEWKIGAKMYYFYNMKMKFSNRCKNTTFGETLHFYNFFSFKNATLQLVILYKIFIMFKNLKTPLFKKWVLTNI